MLALFFSPADAKIRELIEPLRPVRILVSYQGRCPRLMPESPALAEHDGLEPHF
jgi:hypothetical protein